MCSHVSHRRNVVGSSRRTPAVARKVVGFRLGGQSWITHRRRGYLESVGCGLFHGAAQQLVSECTLGLLLGSGDDQGAEVDVHGRLSALLLRFVSGPHDGGNAADDPRTRLPRDTSCGGMRGTRSSPSRLRDDGKGSPLLYVVSSLVHSWSIAVRMNTCWLLIPVRGRVCSSAATMRSSHPFRSATERYG